MITITIISIISTLSIITLICLFRWFWAFRTLWMVTLAISDHDSQRVSSGLSHGSFCLPGETAWCSFSSSRIWESSSTSGWLYLHICIYIYVHMHIYIYVHIINIYIYTQTCSMYVIYIYIYITRYCWHKESWWMSWPSTWRVNHGIALNQHGQPHTLLRVSPPWAFFKMKPARNAWNAWKCGVL